MSLPGHKEELVRRLLGGSHPTVSPDLAERAAEHGRRILRRRRVLTVAALLLLAALVASAVLTAVTRPGQTGAAPPFEGW